MTRFFITALVVLSILPATAAPEIIAHRGASYQAPENTVSSFNLAWRENTDACELDCYLTADHQIAVMHDGTTARTTGVSMKMRTTELADLRKLDAGKWKNRQYTGEKIPTLAEALATMPAGKRFFVEVKCGAEIVPYLLQVFDASGKDPKQLVVISFYPEVIQAVEKMRPELKTYYLCSPKPSNVEKLTRVARVIGADGIDGNGTEGFNADVIAQFRKAGLGVYVWTIDDPTIARKYADLGIDGITTNKPAFMRTVLAGEPAASK